MYPSSSSNIYSRYYLEQAGYGAGGSVFQGTRIQRGYGLGGFFASMFRSAMPMIKEGAKAAGKSLLRTGLDIVQDALAGESIKAAAKQRFSQTGRELANRAVDHLKSQAGSGPLTFKRKHLIPFLQAAKRRRIQKKKPKKRDIFG